MRRMAILALLMMFVALAASEQEDYFLAASMTGRYGRK